MLEMKAAEVLASAPGEMICTGAEMGVYDVDGRWRLPLAKSVEATPGP